jgi:exosortase
MNQHLLFLVAAPTAKATKARNLLGVGYAMPEMKTAVARTGFRAPTATKIAVWPSVVSLLVFAWLWFEVINQLKAEWSLNPQYGYGWSVPFLALYLIWKRWQTRPSPRPPDSRAWPIAIIILCAFLFFPIRFVAEANPDWRLLSWALTFIAIAISICFIFLVGGRPWLSYFAFPLLFFFVAVPWPMHVEQVVTQNLMRAVSAINVALVNAAGIPAVQHGNVIEVGTGFIGIEEACSGVRSLQATLMISLFLGELYTFKLWPRLFLVAVGALLAFFCNLVRTALLVWIGAKRGTNAIEGWHDPAGVTILLVCLFGLWLVSLVIQGHSNLAIESCDLENKRGPLRFSRPLLVSLALWLFLAEGGVQIWYRLHQSAIADSRWAVNWPTSETDYKSVAIAPEAESLLRYNEGGGATWKASDGRPWMMYFFRWFPGRTAALFVKIHRPDICLPASGMTLNRDNGIRLLTTNGVSLPVRSYRFDDHGAPLHVFYCYWDARSSYENATAASEEDWTARGRLRAALRGRRELGAQMLEVVVWGYEDEGEANQALQRRLAQIIRPG